MVEQRTHKPLVAGSTPASGTSLRPSGYGWQVSPFPKTERENLEGVLASWNTETPVPDEVRRQVREELDAAGLVDRSGREGRLAG